MPKKRSKIFETRYFAFVIGSAIIAVFLALDSATVLFSNLNTKTVDLHFLFKNLVTTTAVQEGVTVKKSNPRISDDIVIVGIDSRSLAKFGKWPFPRSTHANLVDSFARIQEQGDREASLFIDVFMIEPDRDPSDDARLVRSIRNSGRVYMETVLDVGIGAYESRVAMMERQSVLNAKFGSFASVTGPWREMPEFIGVQAPLKPYGRAVAGFGHANYTQDSDEIYRRQALVAKLSQEIEQIRLDHLDTGFAIDEAKFERLAWIDAKGFSHSISTPLTEDGLAALSKRMESEAPPVVVDADGDGVPEDTFHIVRRYRDVFVPAITLTLALDYWGVKAEDVSVEIGKRILVPNPTIFDPATGTRKPYRARVGKGGFFARANGLDDEYRVIDEVSIPINDKGEMLINFMGFRSSSAIDGYQTFPVRSYASYAERVPGPNPETWPATKAVGNKILMVGPFADGIAQDEKPTPFGLMYGIEIHANALNTMLMGNFLTSIPRWADALLLALLVMAAAFICSRLSSLVSLFVVALSSIAFFLVCTFIFEYRSLIINYPMPAIGMIITFVSVLAYRTMTEERDKKQLRVTFGKYVSPKVVDQILEHPPELGGVDKELTVLFSDIRGFTTLSENMSPQELVNHLNLYLTAMTDIILEFGGTLDKYVGDEIMCFWGAPLPQVDHAELACKCAIRQMEKLRELNEGWPESRRINIGIGLNSGIMTVGNMGSPGRMNYTLMGDNVNLGARLEGTNKQYGTGIIISENTYGLVRDKFVFRELDNIRVKGKNKPVLIFELVDSIEPIVPPKLDDGSTAKR